MSGKRWWNFSSLKKYIHEIETKGTAGAGSEIVNGKQRVDEYVMLALRSAGLDIREFNERFSGSTRDREELQGVGEELSFNPADWIKQKNDYFIQLKNQNLLEIDDHFIRLTKKGYAVCDEILGNLL